MNIIEYGGVRPVDRTRTLFGQVMWYVAATAGLFALGAYLGRNLAVGVAFGCYLLAFACLIGCGSRSAAPPGSASRCCSVSGC